MVSDLERSLTLDLMDQLFVGVPGLSAEEREFAERLHYWTLVAAFVPVLQDVVDYHQQRHSRSMSLNLTVRLIPQMRRGEPRQVAQTHLQFARQGGIGAMETVHRRQLKHAVSSQWGGY